MRTGRYTVAGFSYVQSVEVHLTSPVAPASLRLVTSHELEVLKSALTKGALPADLQWKLAKLESGSFMHQFIAQQSRLLAIILVAAYAGAFKDASPEACDDILRVLAYVRKDEDVIPDYTSGGYSDDLQEVRALITRLQPLLARFKAWRLCHQVPDMWRN